MALNGVGARRRIVNHNHLSHFNFLPHSRSMQASIDIVDSMFEELCRTLTAGRDRLFRRHVLDILPQTLVEGLMPIGWGLRTAWRSV
jgi:hypothetical protein